MNIWNTATQMAAATPDSRNRYIDLLRALSILIVVIGHWLIAGFAYVDGEVATIQVLAHLPQTQYLTWLFQVMPIFFIVGGYSNAISLISAQRKQQRYGAWLAGRLDRLVRPLLPLVGLWAVICLVLNFMGIPGEDIQKLTQIALIPIWFLAIYIFVVVLAPLTFKLWRKFGVSSVVAFMAMAVLVDVSVFNLNAIWAGWSNYIWVWLGVHQLGYGWQSGRFKGQGAKSLLVSLGGWLMLATLVYFGPYPLAMVGSPDPDISNTLPPKITLLALAIAQFGLVLFLENPINRWLQSLRPWALTVLVNSMIMTLYLWHITVMLALVFVLWLLSGLGLGLEVGSLEWWLTRPIWIGALFVILLPLSLVLSPVEQTARPSDWRTTSWRLVSGAIAICIGIAILAMFGMTSAPIPFAGSGAVIAIFAGAVFAGVLGLGKRAR